MRTRSLFTLLILSTAACSTIRSTASDPAAASSFATIHDELIEQELSGKGAALLAGGAAPGQTNLVAQLTRRACQLSLPAASGERLTSTELCDRARASVVVIGGLFKCKKCSEWHVSTASAFPVAEPDVFLTNYHVVNDLKVAILAARSIQGTVSAVTEVLAADRSADFALVRIPGLNLRPIPLRASAAPGSPIAVVSHPNHRFFSFTSGFVSRYYRQARKPGQPVVEWVQITAEFAKGSSGAPVLDECGNAIAMVASTQAVLYDEKDASTAQMIFRDCVPARAVLNAIKPATP